MSENPTNPQERDIEEDALDACKAIRDATVNPVGWIFPTMNQCVSCVILTGGHPEIMAPYCPRVISRLSEQAQANPTLEDTEDTTDKKISDYLGY